MAINELGVSFLDPFTRKRREQGEAPGPGPQGSPVQVLALQLPRILGSAALAPRQLLDPTLRGALAPPSDVGPRMSGLAEAIASSVVQNVAQQNQGPGTNLLGLGLTPSAPPAAPSISAPPPPASAPLRPSAPPPSAPRQVPASPFPVAKPEPAPVPRPAPPPIITPAEPPGPSLPPPFIAEPSIEEPPILRRLRDFLSFNRED